MADVAKGVVGVLALLLLQPACSSDTTSSDNGLGVCVEDARKPVGCQTRWELLDPCGVVPSATILEAAVFEVQCPPDSALSAGDTSLALQRQSVAPDQPVLPAQELAQKPYGFAFLLRDDACHVIAWGCTEADLGVVTHIQTAVQNWSAPTQSDMCTTATGGGCVAPATCNAGACE